jgi:hypothetical protein
MKECFRLRSFISEFKGKAVSPKARALTRTMTWAAWKVSIVFESESCVGWAYPGGGGESYGIFLMVDD